MRIRRVKSNIDDVATFARTVPFIPARVTFEAANDPHGNICEYLELPNISVFDKDGKLPVNLQRTGLQGELPFKGDLLRSIAEDICAHAILEAPEPSDRPWFVGQYEGFSSTRENVYDPDWARWLIGRDGFILNEPNLLADFGPKTILVALGGELGYQNWGEIIRSQLPNDVLAVSALPHVLSDSNPRIKGIVRKATSWWAAKPQISEQRKKRSVSGKSLLSNSASTRRVRSMHRLPSSLAQAYPV